MTTKLTADWLAATITTDLGVTCKKDMPAFDRPDIATGAYIGWSASDPLYGERISSSIDRSEVQFGLLVVTANEVALWAMVDAIQAMMKARTAATIDSKYTKIKFAIVQRAENPFFTEALRYAASTTVQFVR